MRALLATALLALPIWALETGSFDRTLNVSGTVDLDVQTGSGSIAVRSGGATTVQIRGTIRAHDGYSNDNRIRELERNPPIEQSGNSIRIGHIQDEDLMRHISISYEITVPRSTHLRSRTGSGRQSVEDIQGPADVGTGSGGVSVSRVAGEVRAHTGSGSMELSSIQGRLDAHTGSGSIHAMGISGPINVDTGSGSVQLEQTAAGSVDARTGSGGVNLRLPSNAGYDLEARTGSGNVTVDQPMTVRGTINRHELHGQIRGGGNLVRVSTGSGSVRIE